jgi:integrase/recombinase XerD
MTRRPPIADWPARDRTAWEKGVKPAALFGRGGRGANWSEGSRFMIARGYRYWLSWLAEKGLCDSNLGPANRVTRDRVENYIAELKPTRSSYTVLCRVQTLYDALRAMAPEADWAWLLEIYRTLCAAVRPVRDKRPRLRSIEEVAALGERLMETAKAAALSSAVRRAVLFRDGLMIALLSYRPMRLKNFAGMQLGRHLKKVGGNWHILLAANETKTRVPYQAIVPAALAPKLECYLSVHRPVLIRGKRIRDPANGSIFRERKTSSDPELDAVWISEVGTHLTQESLACRVVKRTEAAFGLSISPHLFRDVAATSIAVDNPKHIGDASLVLGHAGHTTTQKHYNHARSLDASRRHAAMIASLRESLEGKGNR